MEPITITVARALEVSGLGRTKLYSEIASGKLETITVGRRRLVKVASLRAMLEAA